MRLLLSATLVFVAACGAVPHPLAGNAHPTPPTGALVAWQTFPADQTPRLIVPFWSIFSAAGGFTGGGTEKIAGMCGKLTLAAVTLPAEVPGAALAKWPDGTTATYRAISASDAFTGLIRVATEMQGAECASAAALPVTSARFGNALLKTDRGTATVSSWLFTATGVLGEMAYPALPRSAYWDDGTTRRSWGEGATMSGDAHSLTFTFTGAPDNPGPCGADYTAAVAESSSAIAVAVLAIPHSAPDAPIACAAIAAFRTVTVALAGPLGGRVVVNASGDVVTVCPEATRSSC
jgi:hypothetical protein